MRPLVIVRPEPGASASATAARQAGLNALVMPLFSVAPLEWQAPGVRDFDALLLTSANAVRHGGPQIEGLRDLPAHCVGGATAVAARDAGFAIGVVGSSGVDSLLDSLPDGVRLLHLCGADRRSPNRAEQSITVLPVYAAVELPAPPEFAEISGAVVAAHSPRAASRLAELVEQAGIARETIAIAAISADAAAAAGPGWERIEAAAEPSDTALLALASSLCNNC